MQYVKTISLLLLISAFSCSSDSELKKSVFISDKDNPELPQYSEWGYNTFGAFYDRQAFISNDIQVPLKITVDADGTNFIFKGQLGGSYNNTSASLTVTIEGFTPNTYTDLASLNNTILDLKDPKYTLALEVDGDIKEVQIIDGTFEFKRIQNLIVDKKQEEIILSGVFDFQAIINAEPISFSNGRFDVGVGTNNFFVF